MDPANFSLEAFNQALHDLFQERPRLRGRIEAVFAGNFRDENMRLVSALGLQDAVRVLGYLSHRDCLRQVVASDLVWMIVGDDLGSPGKTYEYIGAGKPILGLAPEGFIKQAILEAGGRVAAPRDVPAIALLVLSSVVGAGSGQAAHDAHRRRHEPGSELIRHVPIDDSNIRAAARGKGRGR